MTIQQQLLACLTSRGYEGARLCELPPHLRTPELLTICDADRLIEFGRGVHWNHWTFRPGFKPIAEFIGEVLAKSDDEMERVRLTPKGHVESARQQMESAGGETGTESLASLPDDAMMNHADLATALGIEAERLRQRLNRWRRKNGDGWQELTEASSKEPRYLYRVKDVREVLREAINAK